MAIQNLKLKIILGAVGILLFTYLLRFFNPAEFAASLRKTNPFLIGIIIIINFVMLFFCALRWRFLLKFINLKPSLQKSYFFYTISASLGYLTPGKVGDFTRGVLIDETHNSKKKSSRKITGLSFVAQEKILEITLLIILAIASIFIYALEFKSINLPLIIIIVSFLAVLFIVAFYLYPAIHKRLYKSVNNEIIKRVLRKLLIFSDSFRLLIKTPKLMMKLLAATLAIWILTFLQLYLLVLAFGSSISYWQALAAISISLLIGIASMIPVGIGVQDISLAYLLTVFGLQKSLSTSIVVAYRIFVAVPIILLGVIFLLIYLRRKSSAKA